MGIDFELPVGATPIDPDEAGGLIPSITTQAELNEFELINIGEAVEWARKSRQAKESILEEKILKSLHREMFGKTWKWAGKFRQTQKSIGIEAYRISAELHTLAADVEFWLANQTYPPEEIAARFHHRLVSIHPFPDGNGRHARLATDLFCEREGWPIPTWGASDLVATSDARARDIAALKAADAHDIQPLLTFLETRS